MFKRYEDMISEMEREMQRFQQEAFGTLLGTGLPARMWQPNVDICESDDCIWVRVEAAGVNLSHTRVTLAADNRVLTVSGDRPEPEDASTGRRRCHQLEVYFGRFQRDILLPNVPLDRDNVTANYKDGFLVITCPKLSAPAEPPTSIHVTGD